MKLYAIIPRGVYDHECAGIFSTKEKAEAWAKKMDKVNDGHHTLYIEEYTLDEGVDISGLLSGWVWSR